MTTRKTHSSQSFYLLPAIYHLLLMLLWLAIGTGLRFLRLESLPPWTDECATIVFSLGNSFRTVPLNQFISSDVLMQPLQPNAASGISDVIHHLLDESTHPPVYFALAHFWMKLFSPTGELASIWTARSLSALLGVASIPAMYGFGYLAFGSKLVGHMAAAMMAVSPYAVFLAREARHYTLVILLVIACLCCFVKAVQTIHRQQSLPMWVVLAWVAINSLGVATHYFFTLTLCAEGLVLLWQLWRNKHSRVAYLSSHWWRITIVILGTLIGCLVWIPILKSIPSNELTNWVASSNPHVRWLEPIGRLLLWAMSMLLLLPSAITNLPVAIVIVSGLVTLLFLLWSLPVLNQGLQMQQQDPDRHLAVQVLWGYVFGAIALCLCFTYGLRKDLTLAARFQFIYAPVIILLLGVALAGCWHQVQNFKHYKRKFSLYVNGKLAVSIILLMAMIGGVTVVGNLGYLQNQRPDILAALIQKVSKEKVLIATNHLHHGQTGRMMGLAWEFQHLPSQNVQFYLVHQDPDKQEYAQAMQGFYEQVTKIPRPLDLWLVEFRVPLDLESQQCFRDQQYGKSAGEYSYKLYHCGIQKTDAY